MRASRVAIRHRASAPPAPTIPRDGFDGTLALAADPYGFIAKRCRRHGSDVFRTRLLLQDTICMMGRDAAALFYTPDRFVRHGAPPGRLQKTLFGVGGVQALDGDAHRHRKQLFLSLMTPERIHELGERSRDAWHAYVRKWASMPAVVLYDELREMLTRVACAWAGVPLEERAIRARSEELTALFDAAGAVGPKHWRGRWARRRAERWSAEVIAEVRAGRIASREDRAAQAIARHRDLDGKPLAPRVAAVELLNVLRPTVAVAVYLVFVAHALHRHPECRRKLRDGVPGYAGQFVQEVRRFYPFFPSVVARVRDDFAWRGFRFPRNTRVVLDLHGTNHDPRLWPGPEQFRPERFAGWGGDPFTLVPQGGGDHALGHRCPGEWGTIALMTAAADLLAKHVSWDVPPQDLRIDRSRLPAMVRSGFVVRDVRLLG